MEDYKFLSKVFWAFLASFFCVISVLEIMKIAPITRINPDYGHAFTIFSVLFVGLCFAMYTLKVFIYELVYTAKKAIKDADQEYK